MRIAIDVGGTFTDVLLYEETTGELLSAKVSSDPWNPAGPFMAGLERVLKAARAGLGQVDQIVHGTTVVTNALLEGKTAKVGLLVTRGFRDLLEIGRQQRPALYDLMRDRRAPLVPRDQVLEVPERVGPDGDVLTPLDESAVQQVIRAFAQMDVEALAISLLFSFRNPVHERRLGEMARALLPRAFVFLSSDVLPEFREYERTSTTVVAAAVAPKVVTYLEAITQELARHNWRKEGFTVMHSGGGTLSSQEATRRPHTLVESGPAAGLIAAAHVARELGLDRVIGFDMGGTTAKAGLILAGVPRYTSEYEVGGDFHHGWRVRGSGYPVRFPMIDVAECGAGAGSIAWVDQGGHLRVGPESAGADPGPACYGKGGKHPTVTDAQVVLGRLAPAAFLGGEMRLEPDLAARAIMEKVGTPLGMGLEEAAWGIVAIANANMLRILRVVSVARGHDPRDFTLLAYGGAGPLHATELAEAMSISRVIIPRLPGLFSSLGLLYADMSVDFVETVMLPLEPEALPALNAVMDQFLQEAEAWFAHAQVPMGSRALHASADLRYHRQNYELSLPLPQGHLSSEDVPGILERFHAAHAAAYGHNAPGEKVQVVNLRLQAVRLLPKPRLRTVGKAKDPAPPSLPDDALVWFEGGPCATRIYERAHLCAGHRVPGPAIVRERESTTLVGPGWTMEVDPYGNLVLGKTPFVSESRADEAPKTWTR